MEPLTTIVMAGGLGTRMRSDRPKVLHDLCGRPMLGWVVAAAREAGAGQVVAVVSPPIADAVSAAMPDVRVAVQEPALGTGHAVEVGLAAVPEDAGTVVVLSGDTPALRPDTIERVIAARREAGADAALVTARIPPPNPYGRIVRGPAGVARIVEARDATAAELALDEINAGVYCFDAGALREALGQLSTDNAQGERYLTDVIGLLGAAGRRVAGVLDDDPASCEGVNTMVELAAMEAELNRRLCERAMLDGVRIVDPSSTFLDVDVELERGVRIEPFCILRGRTRVGAGALIGPNVVATDAVIGPGCSVGPFATLRPGTVLEAQARVGRFVETKNAVLRRGAKVPHLSYVGDAEIGEQTNIGAGNITSNYDGYRKHRTVIGSRVKTGANAVFVAPVSIGDDAVIGAVSAITDDVPAGALGIARPRQTTMEGYAERAARRRAQT